MSPHAKGIPISRHIQCTTKLLNQCMLGYKMAALKFVCDILKKCQYWQYILGWFELYILKIQCPQEVLEQFVKFTKLI